MSIADQIEKIGRALTADELSKLLSVSKVTIFKHVEGWPLVAAGAFDVILPPNNDVPDFRPLLGTDFSGAAGRHQALPSERIRQKVNLRFGPRAGKFGVMHDVQD